MGAICSGWSAGCLTDFLDTWDFYEELRKLKSAGYWISIAMNLMNLNTAVNLRLQHPEGSSEGVL